MPILYPNYPNPLLQIHFHTSRHPHSHKLPKSQIEIHRCFHPLSPVTPWLTPEILVTETHRRSPMLHCQRNRRPLQHSPLFTLASPHPPPFISPPPVNHAPNQKLRSPWPYSAPRRPSPLLLHRRLHLPPPIPRETPLLSHHRSPPSLQLRCHSCFGHCYSTCDQCFNNRISHDRCCVVTNQCYEFSISRHWCFLADEGDFRDSSSSAILDGFKHSCSNNRRPTCCLQSSFSYSKTPSSPDKAVLRFLPRLQVHLFLYFDSFFFIRKWGHLFVLSVGRELAADIGLLPVILMDFFWKSWSCCSS